MKIVIVKGRAISINNTKSTKTRWKQKVAVAGKKVFSKPLTSLDLRVTITFFYNGNLCFDTDNVSKPICDALKGIAYKDDIQIMERNAHRRDINGSFRIKGIDPEIAKAIAEGVDFISIQIENIGKGVERI